MFFLFLIDFIFINISNFVFFLNLFKKVFVIFIIFSEFKLNFFSFFSFIFIYFKNFYNNINIILF